jgi:putative addiction module antidote
MTFRWKPSAKASCELDGCELDGCVIEIYVLTIVRTGRLSGGAIAPHPSFRTFSIWLRLCLVPVYSTFRPYRGSLIVISLKLTSIGNSVGLVLPKDVLAKLKVEKGDVVYLTESPEGYRLTPYDPAFERQMEIARGVMKKRRNALRELAR